MELCGGAPDLLRRHIVRADFQNQPGYNQGKASYFRWCSPSFINVCVEQIVQLPPNSRDVTKRKKSVEQTYDIGSLYHWQALQHSQVHPTFLTSKAFRSEFDIFAASARGFPSRHMKQQETRLYKTWKKLKRALKGSIWSFRSIEVVRKGRGNIENRTSGVVHRAIGDIISPVIWRCESKSCSHVRRRQLRRDEILWK